MDIISNLKFGRAASILIPSLWQGLGMVVKITIIAFVIGAILGLLIALGRVSKKKFLNGFLICVIELIRGTPLLVQVVYMYYVMPLIIDIFIRLAGSDYNFQLNAMVAGILALAINYGCYLSEVIRSAILSIDSGQTEAALALGYSKSKAMFEIVIPQAMKSAVPVFGNYLVMMIKDTSLLAYITVNELLLRTQSFASQTFLTIESYTILAGAYLLISVPMSQLVKFVERKMNK